MRPRHSPTHGRSFLQAEKDERVERRKEGTDSTEEEPPADQAVLLERLDALELLQQRLGNTGDSILAMTRKNAAGSALKRLKTEKEAAESRLAQVCPQSVLRRRLRPLWHCRISTARRALPLHTPLSRRHLAPQIEKEHANMLRELEHLRMSDHGRDLELQDLRSALRTAKEELTIAKASSRKPAAARPTTAATDGAPSRSNEIVDFSGYAIVDAGSFSALCEGAPSLFRSVGGELFRRRDVTAVA